MPSGSTPVKDEELALVLITSLHICPFIDLDQRLNWAELGLFKSAIGQHEGFMGKTSEVGTWSGSERSSSACWLRLKEIHVRHPVKRDLTIAKRDSFGIGAGFPTELLMTYTTFHWYSRLTLSSQLIKNKHLPLQYLLHPAASCIRRCFGSVCLALRLLCQVVTLESGQLVVCLVTWQGNT